MPGNIKKQMLGVWQGREKETSQKELRREAAYCYMHMVWKCVKTVM